MRSRLTNSHGAERSSCSSHDADETSGRFADAITSGVGRARSVRATITDVCGWPTRTRVSGNAALTASGGRLRETKQNSLGLHLGPATLRTTEMMDCRFSHSAKHTKGWRSRPTMLQMTRSSSPSCRILISRALSSKRDSAASASRRLKPVCAVMMAACCAGRSDDSEAFRRPAVPAPWARGRGRSARSIPSPREC